jgi:hypothetical protein
MNKNRIRGGDEQGERANGREALVTKLVDVNAAVAR